MSLDKDTFVHLPTEALEPPERSSEVETHLDRLCEVSRWLDSKPSLSKTEKLRLGNIIGQLYHKTHKPKPAKELR